MVHKKDVENIRSWIGVGKLQLDNFLHFRIVRHIDVFEIELGHALEQHINAFVFVSLFLAIETLGHKLKNERRMNPMFIGGFEQEF